MKINSKKYLLVVKKKEVGDNFERCRCLTSQGRQNQGAAMHPFRLQTSSCISTKQDTAAKNGVKSYILEPSMAFTAVQSKEPLLLQLEHHDDWR